MMDSVNKCSDESSWRWTNEKHLKFLNSIENSFVQTMLEKGNISANSGLPLDRYLPDTCESTLDLTKPRRRRYSTSDIMEQRSVKKSKTKKLVSRPLIISDEDQVVPNGNRRGWGRMPEEKSNCTRVDADVDATSSE